MTNKTNKIYNKNEIRKYTGINLRINNEFIFKKINNQKEKFFIGIDNQVNDFINFYKNIYSYIGLRHKKNLPTRGQRTKTNARTRKKKKSKKA